MRDGAYIDTVPTADVSIDRIIAMMVGREIYQPQSRTVWRRRRRRRCWKSRSFAGNVLRDISFSLRKGEILGVAGLVGAGRTEMARAIFGADPIDAGELYIHGREDARISGPYQAVKHGIGYLSEDRKHFGCLLDMDVKTNVALAAMGRFTKLGFINDKRMADVSVKVVEDLRVKTPGIGQKLKFLSGGNQQKAIIGKWLTRDCDILIFDEPTRGIDVGAKSEIYKLLESLAAEGKSIIMISSELPEILRLSHRIIVMCEGRITGELINDHNASQEQIMTYATKRIG